MFDSLDRGVQDVPQDQFFEKIKLQQKQDADLLREMDSAELPNFIKLTEPDTEEMNKYLEPNLGIDDSTSDVVIDGG